MPGSAAWWEASFDAAARLGISEREMFAMLPRELFRRARMQRRDAWEQAVTAACIVANRLRWSKDDPILTPKDFLAWLREDGEAEPDEDLEAIEAEIIARGEALSARFQAERNDQPDDA